MSSNPSGIFSKALEIDDLVERERFLVESCNGKSSPLYKEVHSLLESFQKTDSFFENPLSVLPEIKKTAEESLLSFPNEFGNYTLLEEIGHGGMGVVYKAKQNKLKRFVALKMIKDGRFATQSIIKRFYAEAEAASHLSHPNIVPVYETGRIEGQYFYSMGYVNGPNLEEWIYQHGPLTVETAVPLLEVIARAVSYAHRQGIIHRDLKPANILLAKQSNPDSNSFGYDPVISDFGLAKRTNHEDGFTLNGEIIGTPGFMAPEQINKHTNQAAFTVDIYSLGALLFFMLTSKPPIKGSNVLESLHKIANEEPKSLRSHIPDISQDINTICSKCLERTPEQRYQNAPDLVHDLKCYQSGYPILARKASWLERLIKLCKRHPTGSLAAGLSIFLLLGSILIPIFWAIESSRHLRVVQEANTKAIKEQAEAIFNSAVVQTNNDHSVECLSQFFETAQLARQLNDVHLENIARWNIGARVNDYWIFENSIDLGKNIDSVLFSPDQKEFAAYNKSEITLHDSENGDLKHSIPLANSVRNFLYHPTKKEILTLDSKTGQISIWKKQGKFLKPILFPFDLKSAPERIRENMWISTFSFRNQGQTIIIADNKGNLLSWNYDTGKFIELLVTYDSPIFRYDLSKNSKRLLVTLESGEIHGTNLETNTPLFKPFQHTPYPSFITFGNNENSFLLPTRGDHDFLIRKYKIDSDKVKAAELTNTFIHNSVVYDIFEEPSNNLLISASRDNSIRFWNPSNGQYVFAPTKLNYNPKSLFLSKNNDHLHTSTTKGQILKWKRPDGNLIWYKKTNTDLNDVVFTSSDDQFIVSSRDNETLLIYNKKTNEQSEHLLKHRLPAKTFVDERICRCESRTSYFSNFPGSLEVHEYNWENGELTNKYGPLNHPVLRTTISHDEQHLAILTESEIRVIHLETNQTYSIPIQNVKNHTPFVFSSNNSKILVGQLNGTIDWYDFRSGENTRTEKFEEGSIKGLSIYPEKQLISVASDNTTAAVLNEFTWQRVSPPIKHDQRVALVKFAKNGELLLTATKGKTVHIWDIKTGKPICPPFLHEGRVRHIELSPSGRQLLTTDIKGNISIWKFPEMDSRSLEEIEQWIKTKMDPF